MSELVQATWGSIRLWATDIHTESSRTQVVHNLSSGDIHPVQDRGLRERRDRCTLVFDDFPGQPTPAEAFQRIEAAKNSGAAAIFTHPLGASYLARIGEFSGQLNEDDTISATAEFIQDGDIEPVTPAGAATSGVTGEASVNQAADDMDAALEAQVIGFPKGVPAKIDFSKPVDTAIPHAFTLNKQANLDETFTVGANFGGSADFGVAATGTGFASGSVIAFADAFILASGSATAAASADASAFAFSYASAALTSDARSAVSSWASTPDLSTRQVLIDAARLSAGVSSMIEVGGFENDLQLFDAFKAAIMLGQAIRSAALAATSETKSVFVMRVTTTTALLPLAARIYGGAEAQDRTRQIEQLNDIPTPGWLDVGDYLMPTRTPAQQAPF
jgi:hypothetical protein